MDRTQLVAVVIQFSLTVPILVLCLRLLPEHPWLAAVAVMVCLGVSHLATNVAVRRLRGLPEDVE